MDLRLPIVILAIGLIGIPAWIALFGRFAAWLHTHAPEYIKDFVLLALLPAIVAEAVVIAAVMGWLTLDALVLSPTELAVLAAGALLGLAFVFDESGLRLRFLRSGLRRRPSKVGPIRKR